MEGIEKKQKAMIVMKMLFISYYQIYYRVSTEESGERMTWRVAKTPASSLEITEGHDIALGFKLVQYPVRGFLIPLSEMLKVFAEERTCELVNSPLEFALLNANAKVEELRLIIKALEEKIEDQRR